MLSTLFNINITGGVTAIVSIIAGILTFVLTAALKEKLPRDGGRKFAVNGELSLGKPRGAGIIFVLVFAVASLMLLPLKTEYFVYLAAIILEMLTGYLDDASEKPWGELKKGICDLVIAVSVSVTYVIFNGSGFVFAICGCAVTLPAWLFVILATALIWMSINVTNCSDGVDGLSSSLTIVMLGSFIVVMKLIGSLPQASYMCAVMIACLLAYLWFNASPSKLLMGDAGSRAMGILLAIAALTSGAPLMYIPICIVFILDGGLGLLKVSLIRVFKIYILKNTRTPLHDNARKNKGWSDTQTVFRFVILSVAVSAVYITLAAVFLTARG